MSNYPVHVNFPGRLVFVGFGSIGQGVLPLVLRHIGIKADQITIVTADDAGEKVAAEYGVRYIRHPLTRENFRNVLDPLVGRGDFLLNLSVDVSSVALIQFCWEKATFDLQFTGFDTAEIDLVLNPIDASEEESPDDEAPAPNAVAVSRVGDVWMLGEHRLVCGDALSSETFDVLMGGEAARLVLSDVPYNVPVDGHVGGLGKTQHREFVQASGEMTDAEFEDFLRKAIVVMVANLMDGGIVGLFIDWRSVETMLRVGRELGLKLLNLIVWNKSNGGMGSLYRSKHELLCLFKKGKASHVNNVMLGAKGRYRTNVWDYAGVNTFGAGRMADLEAHPTVKPVAMIADAIMDLTDRGELVIDSFVGSGTTIVAAQKTGRIARCTELDPLYVDVAIRRFKARFGIDAVHQATGLTFDALAMQRDESSVAATSPIVVPPPVRARVRPTASVGEV